MIVRWQRKQTSSSGLSHGGSLTTKLKVFVSYKGGHNKVHGSHYAHMGKPAPAPAMGHHNAPMHDKGARVMNDKGHNMGNHSNAHKAPNREVAMNTRNNHGGSGHFGGRR